MARPASSFLLPLLFRPPPPPSFQPSSSPFFSDLLLLLLFRPPPSSSFQISSFFFFSDLLLPLLLFRPPPPPSFQTSSFFNILIPLNNNRAQTYFGKPHRRNVTPVGYFNVLGCYLKITLSWSSLIGQPLPLSEGSTL